MGFINKVTYGTMTDQANDMVGFTVDVGVDPPTPVTFNAVVEAMVATPHRSRAIKLVIPPGGGNDLGVEAFCRRWKQAGYFLVAVHDGQLSYRWEMYLDYLIVHLTQAKWPVFKCNELIYPMDLGPSPALPHPAPKLMVDPGATPPPTVWKWLDESPDPWHVLLKRKGVLSKVVYTT